ncbi:MAG: Wzz/FepE/Etk N-terminal domain-containing protein [Chloroflexota bacterium]
MYEEEIDLRPYILALVEKWYWIIGTAVAAAVIALVLASIVPPTYEAETAVAVVRSRTDITFDPRIVTEDDAFARDQNARRSALVALVTSTDVIEAVITEMGDQLAPHNRRVTALRQMASASSDGDLIRIRISHGDPQIAAALANSWGRQYEQHINQLFGGSRGEGLEMIGVQVQTARSQYEAAQADLETFTRRNRISALTREVESLEQVLSDYYGLLAGLQGNPVQLSRGVLAQHYTDLQRIESWSLAAQSLRQQVAAAGNSPGAAAGNQVGYMALHSQIYGSMPLSATVPVELQLVMGELTQTAVVPADVDTLLTVLAQRRLDTIAQIEALSEELLPAGRAVVGAGEERPLQEAVDTLTQQISSLQAELIAQEAEQDELLEARQLAWTTYQSLTRKQAETEIAAQTVGSEVRVASRATVPAQRAGAGNLMQIMLAFVLGLFCATIAVLGFRWWQEVSVSPAS